MQFSVSCLVVIFIAEFVSADKMCGMPNGNAGECKLLKKCKPLNELNKKRGKTSDEILYLRQSTCSVTSNYQTLICCPPESQWSNFKCVKPVVYDEITKYESMPKEKPNTLTITNNNIDGGIDSRNDDRNPDNQQEKEKVSPLLNLIQKDASDCGKDTSNANRIIGGGMAAIDQFPWLVLLEYEYGLTLCGGSLITTRFVLTAAHCLRKTNEPRFARLAEYNTTSFPTDEVEVDGGGFDTITVEIVEIEKNIAHPNYTRQHLHHDIGLSKLKNDVTLTDFIQVICLPTQNFMKDFKVPQNFTVAGWGSDGKKFSEVKKYVKVPYVPNNECQGSYQFNKITDGQICAGGNLKEDSCSGDSGGPLMYDLESTYIAVGIVSFGTAECGKENVPGVYTYVFQYLDWIKDNMI